MDGEEDVSFCSVQYSSTRIRVRVRVRVFILFHCVQRVLYAFCHQLIIYLQWEVSAKITMSRNCRERSRAVK